MEIRYCRTLEFIGSSNLPPKGSEFWYPIAEFHFSSLIFFRVSQTPENIFREIISFKK